MTNTNNNEHPDNNLDRLLELGKPAPKMSEQLKTEIRARLFEIKPETAKRKIFYFRWAVLPLAAASALALFIIFPWLGNISGSVTWADVQKQLEHVNSFSFNGCVHTETPAGERSGMCGSVYYRIPGLFRMEISATESTGMEPGPGTIYIFKQEPGRTEFMQLNTLSRQARLETWLSNTSEVRQLFYMSFFSPPSEILDLIKKITEDETKIIGPREINGVSAVGFSFVLDPHGEGAPGSSTTVSGKLWVNSDDNTPMIVEIDELYNGIRSHAECTDIRINKPLKDHLFEFTIPENYKIKRTIVKTTRYRGNRLKSGVTLEIFSNNNELLITTDDINRLFEVRETTYPDSDAAGMMLVTLELKEEGTQLLQDYTKNHPKGILIVNFNSQLKAVASSAKNNPERLTFDLSRLDLSLSEIEEKYFTKTLAVDKGDG